MKIRAEAKRCLAEAYRRNRMFEDQHDTHELRKPIYRRWTGLGTESAYRAVLDDGLMEWANQKPAPRCMGWLTLTRKGVRALVQLRAEFAANHSRMLQQTAYRNSYLANYQLAGGLLK